VAKIRLSLTREEAKTMKIPSIDRSHDLTRRSALWLVGAALIGPQTSAVARASSILVHKDPNCGCCAGWAQHLKAAGFTVAVEETADLETVRNRLGVPADLAACHTAEVGEYVLEGHVPAVAVQRLLEKRPIATGLAVPGMPVGSPGMEGGVPQRYEVVLFGPTGQRPFMRFVGAQSSKDGPNKGALAIMPAGKIGNELR